MTESDPALANSPIGEINLLMGSVIPLVGATGVYATALEAGLATAELPPDANSNHIGTIYAGPLIVLAEVLGGMIYWGTFDREIYYPIVKDLHIKFTNPARGKIRATARLAPEKIKKILTAVTAQGKADFTLNVDLKDTQGVVVALSTGLYQLRKHPA